MAFEAILIGLIAALGWGFGDFYGAKASKKFGGITTIFFIALISTVMYAAVYAIWMRQHSQLDASALWFAASGGFIFALGSGCFFKGLEYGPVSIVSPLGSTYPLLTTALLILFGVVLSIPQTIGIILVVAGIVLAAGLLDSKLTTKRIERGPLLGLVAAIFWGCGIGLYSQSIEIVGWQQTTLVQLIVITLTLWLLVPFIRGEENVFTDFRKKLTAPLLVGTSVVQMIGLLGVNIGVGLFVEYAAVVVAVSALYPVLTVFLALRHLDEKISRPALFGAFMAVLGVALLSFG